MAALANEEMKDNIFSSPSSFFILKDNFENKSNYL
jgi:hypothetical protein